MPQARALWSFCDTRQRLGCFSVASRCYDRREVRVRVAIVVVGDSASENERGAALPYAFGPRRVHASLLDPRMDIEVTVIESRTPDADVIYAEIERFDPDLIGCSAYVWSFPTLAEVLVTAGMFALEVLGYIIITRRFPVLPREGAQVAR